VDVIQIKYTGEFDKVSNNLDLSKYSPDEICFGYPGHLEYVTRNTKVIVEPYSTLVKVKEFPAATLKDKAMDAFGSIYVLVHQPLRHGK
jgi:hypothetical protein